jgi:hypothetical protein
VTDDTQPEIIVIPDTQPPSIVIHDTQPKIIEILDTHPIKTVEIPDTQEILDSVLENDFGMDVPSIQVLDEQFRVTSLKRLFDCFDNKSGEDVNVDVAVNDHQKL